MSVVGRHQDKARTLPNKVYLELAVGLRKQITALSLFFQHASHHGRYDTSDMEAEDKATSL